MPYHHIEQVATTHYSYHGPRASQVKQPRLRRAVVGGGAAAFLVADADADQ